MGTFLTAMIVGAIVTLMLKKGKDCPVGVALRLKDAGWIAQADGEWTLNSVKKPWQAALKTLDGEQAEPEEELESASSF